MLTGIPVWAAASINDVCLLRKAGICITSTTSFTKSISEISCTSVVIGTPTSSFIYLRISIAWDIPIVLKESFLVRLALIYEDLKMYGIPKDSAILLHSTATEMHTSLLSTAHGPAIKKKLLKSPSIIFLSTGCTVISAIILLNYISY